MKCPDCKGELIGQSAVNGMARCGSCGMIFPVDDEDKWTALEEEGEEILFEAAPEGLVIPDSIEVEIGWRAWIVEGRWPPGGVPLLKSVSHTKTGLWTPGQALAARCPRLDALNTAKSKRPAWAKKHDIPYETCGCGLYSAKTREHLLDEMHYALYNYERDGVWKVIGKVKNWGGVIEGEQGWRAELSYPAELYVPFETFATLAEPLEEAYGVEVGIDNWLQDSIDQ